MQFPDAPPHGMILCVEYCRYHYRDNNNSTEEENRAWDEKFFQLTSHEICELASAAHSMSIKKLVDVSCKAIANIIQGKSAEQIRKIFNIDNDFTPEEEHALPKGE